jgi:hypothetical protein
MREVLWSWMAGIIPAATPVALLLPASAAIIEE